MHSYLLHNLIIYVVILAVIIFIGLAIQSFRSKPPQPPKSELEFIAPKTGSYLSRRRYTRRVARQLPDAIDTMLRALKAGIPVEQSLAIVASESMPPINREFELIAADIRYGVRFRQALLNFVHRVPSPLTGMLMSAFNIQRDIGGDLVEILEALVKQLRARALLDEKINAMGAEARASAWVLSLLPVIIIGLILLISPHYYAVVLESLALQLVIGFAFIILILGIFLIWRISTIR